MTHPIHPACAKWPWPSDDEFREIVESIRTNGLAEPIWLTKDGEVLDGKVREKACADAGIEPRYQTYEGCDPIGFVLLKNKHRRHLSSSQKAVVIAHLACLQNGTNQYQKKVGPFAEVTHSQAELSKLSGIATSQIGFVKRVMSKGAPHILSMVEFGAVSAHVAAEAVKLTPLAVQAQWTEADVQREGKKVIQAYPSSLARAVPAKVKHNGRQERLTLFKPTNDKTVTVSEVIKTLRPLVREVKEQSTRHVASMSPAALRIIASTFENIFKAWESGDADTVRRITDRFAREEIRQLKGFFHHDSNCQATQ